MKILRDAVLAALMVVFGIIMIVGIVYFMFSVLTTVLGVKLGALLGVGIVFFLFWTLFFYSYMKDKEDQLEQHRELDDV